MIKPIVKDLEFLRQVSKPIPDNEDISDLVKDMTETMQYHNALGIAAIQIGVPKRVFIIDSYSCGTTFPLIKAINPKVELQGGRFLSNEGCLSLERVYRVLRHNSVKLDNKTYYNTLAVCIQHEMDHLDGKLISDWPNRTLENYSLLF